MWSETTIDHILSNRQYTGCAVNFQSTTVSYKVDIYFTAIGMFPMPTEEELREQME